MKLDLKLWLIIGLVVLVIILILTRPNPDPVDNSIYHREINSQNQQIAVLQNNNTKLRRENDSIKVQGIKSKQEYETKAKEQSVLIAKLKGNPKVITVLKENPIVDSLVNALDSAVMMRDVRIAGLEMLQMKLELNTQAIYANFEESLKLERQKFALAEQQISDLEKQNRKERRKKKLSQILIPVVGVAGLLLGAQL